MLKIKNLRKAYGDHEVIKGIDLEVKPGEIIGFIGMNGSGMIILNSPYGLFEDLQNVMEELLTHLRKDNEASIRLEYLNQPV